MHDITAGGHHHHHVTTADGAQVPEGTRIEPGALWQPTAPANARLWLDVSQGAAGDMLLAALIDAGADAASVAAVLELIAPGKLHLQQRRVERGPFAACKVDVIADEPNPPVRHLADVEAMLAVDGVPEATRSLALSAFRLLAEAEAHVHGMSVEDVHFHEVGALDSIGDIVGVAEAVRTLQVARTSCSTVTVGAGHVHTQHGNLSVPPPAVLQLAVGWDIEAGGPEDVGELCTPTGLALLRAMCDEQETLPRMRVAAVGVGAGTRVRQDRAGVLRALIGRGGGDVGAGEVQEVSANVDDLDPRLWPDVLRQLLDAGALDAWLTPVVMKKGRPAHVVTALATPDRTQQVADVLLTHTSTLGVRTSAPLTRRVLRRGWVSVDVDGHEVRIKVAGKPDAGVITQATPEFVDVETLATALGVPQRVALTRAQAAAWDARLRPGAPWPEAADE
uniref:nickel pincer cofactor biosynthesis protein LarC n=1 Tax=Tessaracoccus timonensis TaxID=2161816 RepID=UPI000D55DD83|nr:nickel pincer cofactor biosynthesis protein LarC [Tessaracoccus timonensis]